MRNLFLGLVLTALLVAAPGCGGGSNAVVVTGTITQNGAPLAEAHVNFIPTSGEGTEGFGITDAAGKYTLSNAMEADAGVAPGEYKVTISKKEVKWDGKSWKEVPGGEKIKDTRANELLPRRYCAPMDTELKATVTAAGPNDFPFTLE